MNDDGIFAIDEDYKVPNFNKKEEENENTDINELTEKKSNEDISYGTKMNSIFKNEAQNFAILNTKQLENSLHNLKENGINCELTCLYDFDLSHDEHLIPDKLFYKDNESWFYDYYMFYKIKKMLHIVFPGVSALNNLGFYYCKEQHAPLFIVNNTKNIKLALAIAPQVYDKI